MMAFYGYTPQVKDYSHLERAGAHIASGIQQLPAAQEAEDKRRLLKEQLAQLKLDIGTAEQVRQERVNQAVAQYKEKLGVDDVDGRVATKIEATFYPPITGGQREDPSKAIMQWSDNDTRFYDWLNSEAVKKYRTESGMENPQYTEQKEAFGRVTDPELQKLGTQDMPSPTMSSQKRRAIAGQYGVSQIPEVKEDIQRQENIEAGKGYVPGQPRARLAASYAERGITPGEGAAKEIVEATPTEQQIATNKRLQDAATQREKTNAERLRLEALRVSIQNRRLTADERRDIIDSKAKNETAKLRLQVQLKAIETGLQKANKDVLGGIDPAVMEQDLKEIEILRSNLMELEDNDALYEGLLNEKGGVKKQKMQSSQSSGLPQFNSPSDPGFQEFRKNNPVGTPFIDGNGATRKLK